jgi:membrane peptidoglycan carboxypeptidase
MFFYFGLYVYGHFSKKLSITAANNYYFYDSNGNNYNGNGENWVSLDDISDYLIDATISVEDKHFFHHLGFDYLRICKAMLSNIKSGETVQGASTITQQYAKNLFLDFGKTWSRKFQEAWITIRLESQYSKDEILEGYLNTINYGGVFGIENASLYYFDKHASDLTLAEASILAGIPKSPSNYSPISNEENAKKRQKIILDSMVKNKYISRDDADLAYNVDLSYVGSSNSSGSSLMYYQDAVINELRGLKSIPSSFLDTNGLKIYTTLNMDFQKKLNESVKNSLNDNSDIQVAGVILDPNTGAILGLTGGRDYKTSQFNRAISSRRQVGSTIKPFLYYAALENGFTSSSTFLSQRTTFAFSDDKTYSPKNYGDLYPDKLISMAAAIAYSDNIFAVKTHLFLGEDTLVNILRRVGITSELEAIPSLALGTEEISLVDMMGAYGTLASGGYRNVPYIIEKVLDQDGNILYEHESHSDLVLNESDVFILNELLTGTYSSDFVDYNYPTLISFSGKLSHKYGIKTGTTDTDRLIFGFNHDLLVGVWTGYDDNRESGSEDSSISKDIWFNTMEGCLADSPDSWYEIPSNVVGVLVDPISGDISDERTAHKRMFYYIKGTEPTITDSNLDGLIPTIKYEE